MDHCRARRADGLLGQHTGYVDQLDRARTRTRLVHRLERLGFTVTVTEPTMVAADAPGP